MQRDLVGVLVISSIRVTYYNINLLKPNDIYIYVVPQRYPPDATF